MQWYERSCFTMCQWHPPAHLHLLCHLSQLLLQLSVMMMFFCLFPHFFSGSDARHFFPPPRYFLPIMILDSCLAHTLNFSQTFFTTPPFMYLCLNFRCIAAANKCVAPFSGSLSITAIFFLMGEYNFAVSPGVFQP